MKSLKTLEAKFVLRIPSRLHQSLRKQAERLDCSLNSLCAMLLENGVNAQVGLSPRLFSKLSYTLQDGLLGVVLFGSHARGNAWDKSDVDLLVVVAPKIDITRDLYRKVVPEDDKISLHFTQAPLQPELAGSLWLECAIDGKIMIDANGQLQRILDQIRRFILSGRMIRKETHGQGYWIRNEKS